MKELISRITVEILKMSWLIVLLFVVTINILLLILFASLYFRHLKNNQPMLIYLLMFKTRTFDFYMSLENHIIFYQTQRKKL